MALARQILLFALVGLFGQIFSELNYNGINSAFDSRYNTTDPYNPALLYQFGERQAIFFQIVVNVTEGTFVDLAAITVSYYDYHVHATAFNTSFPGSTIVAYGQVIDPCVFVSPASTAVLTFNGTTDAKEGQISTVIGALDIPFIYNATVFEYTSPSVLAIDPTANDNFQPSRFYWLNFTGGEGESWGLDVLATDDVAIAVASFGNCPTLKFTNDSAYWTGKALANQTVTTGVVINKAVWYVWVQVSGHNAANVTFTWRLLSSSPVEGPSASPSVSPSSPANDALPQWALALLIVFGLVVGVLLVIVIVMCVKNRRRSTYQGV